MKSFVFRCIYHLQRLIYQVMILKTYSLRLLLEANRFGVEILMIQEVRKIEKNLSILNSGTTDSQFTIDHSP